MKADAKTDIKADAQAQQRSSAPCAGAAESAAGDHRLVLGGVSLFCLINGTIGQARVDSLRLDGKHLLIGDHLIMSRIGYDAGRAVYEIGMYRYGAIRIASK